MSRTAEDEAPKKRAPRKRAPRKTAAAKKATRKTAVRKRAPKKTAPTAESTYDSRVDVATEPTERKAPTPLAGQKKKKRAKQTQSAIIGAVLLIGVGASAAVGFTDQGQIDVNQTIEERNERIRRGDVNANDRSTTVVPVQDTSNQGRADGGLVGLGVGAGPATPPPTPASTTASSTATSTEATASSTDATATSSEEVTLDATADTATSTETGDTPSEESGTSTPTTQ